MKKTLLVKAVLIIGLILPVGLLSALPAHADRDRDFRHFRHFDRDGHWFHGDHDGRIGWWWITGPNVWYWYPRPIYPYGYPYPPYYDYDYPNPPIVIAPPAQGAPPEQSYWYYCDSSKAYYPYVRTCPGGWRKVPATPRAK